MLDFDLFNPAEMTGYVRELAFAEYELVNWLPVVERQDVDYAFSVADKRREEMAAYRGFDVPAPIGDRPGVARVTGAIPPLSKKLMLTEWERLNLQRSQGNSTAAMMIQDLAYDDAALLTESLQARLEYARGTVLQTGTVTFVTDTGFTGVVIDYNINGTAVTAVTAGTLWSDYTNADPVANLRTWTQAYIIRNKGRRPGVFLTSDLVINDMISCQKLRAYTGVGATIPSILTLEQANQVFIAHGCPPVRAYNAQVNVPGSGDTPVLANNKGLLMPAGADTVRFGETTMGVTAEALELVGKGFLTLPTAPGFVGVGMTEFDPVTKWTKVAGLGVPVLKDPNLITIATVR